ncbi:hypothetical protein LCGC14_1076080 [marine sediment metagenome]|uniref:Uncharacterized protein n=1 Tax=marine sediment metagenome TaxID=412755 RepID=A0A0F9QMH0_9ZZZZ
MSEKKISNNDIGLSGELTQKVVSSVAKVSTGSMQKSFKEIQKYL